MVAFSHDNKIDTTEDRLIRKGFIHQNWGTVIECYKKEDIIVYHHTKDNIFFVPNNVAEKFKVN